MKKITRQPQPQEYGAYFHTYISKVKTDDILLTLADARQTTLDFFKNLPKEKWDYCYAPGKWSIRELLQHLIDGERVFAYRALRIARNDQTPLPGFDENLFAENAHADARTAASLLAEYKTVRTATLHLFKSFNEEDFNRIGTSSNSPASPLAIAFIIAGHELHHLGIIRERYL